jgi:hypothetical protein
MTALMRCLRDSVVERFLFDFGNVLMNYFHLIVSKLQDFKTHITEYLKCISRFSTTSVETIFVRINI